ncbi:hypothetical protein [Lactiplantibacillus daowaiensis]|uniref:Uncharacterized protein n=1 Tax=Lactiplantibacillus daowaiensis TaxID=2559918 RepID=A0ABW1RXS6_9LACO|nr:hypothetical protein [Lactiplantibacillus daowaiensis]
MKIKVFQFADGQYLLTKPEMVHSGGMMSKAIIGYRKTNDLFDAYQF